MPIPSSDDSRPDTVNNNNGSRRLSQEIANLQQEIRNDFDLKLKELSGLMHKFKSLLANDGTLNGNISLAANDSKINEDQTNNVTYLFNNVTDKDTKCIPVLTNRVFDAASEPDTIPDATNDIDSSNEQKNNIDAQASGNKSSKSPISLFATESARFESGLYQLNCQLYRFKLELDQELEFREEPLHIHFQNHSELARVLQQISEKMQQEKNAGR